MLKINGNFSPTVGKDYAYTVKAPIVSYSLLPLLEPPPAGPFDKSCKWEVHVLEHGKWRKTEENDKTGETVHYTFTQKSLSRKGIKIVVQKGNQKTEELVKPKKATEPKIVKVELLDSNSKKPSKPLSYGQTVIVKVHCTGHEYGMVNVTLWEDDAVGKGHNKINEKNFAQTKQAEVKRGIAETKFVLSPSFAKMAEAQKAKGSSSEGTTHEYYVTATIKDKNDASNNIEVNVPPTKPVPPLKKRVPVQTPDRPLAPIAASPKKPVVPATPAKPAVPVSPSTTPGITNVVLTKTSATTMHAAIYHNKLHGKKIRFKLMEDDGGKLVDDELINEIYTLPKDTNYLYIAINLKAIPVSKGDDSVKIGDYVIIEDNIQELYVDVEVLETHKETKTGTLKVNSTAFKQDPVDKTNKVVKISENKLVKEKFDKVKEKAEEAVIYISSEIATAIEVDKNGKIISYPDSGAYNGQDEYKEKEDIYCKKISASKSAYPTFKAYIYRGNIKGEAVKKLKQDLKFKTHENAESTVLEVARHSAKNNKNYGDKGPVPPSTIDKLHGLRYKKGTNNDGKTSYRYRIADINNTNFTITKDYKKEYDSGSMNLGTRSSISIDPWNSNELIGCIGIRDTGGGYHSSFTALTKEQKKTYKNKYHCINNYLEGIIPELTGVYGRRGYSDSEDLSVLESTYDHEVKVFVLVDPLPEIDSCNCKDLKGPKERRPFYDSFGTKTIDYIEKKSTTNKFRALYMLAQKRKETGFLLVNLGKNPMNIKGSGDLGQTSIDTHETIKGKYVSIPGEKFANFSTEDKGFQGYLDLLDSNYNDAYKSLFDDSKTIDDFTAGLEDTGKLGAYATGKAQGGLTGTEDYKLKVKELFNGIKKDYLIMYECKLCKEKDSEKKKKIQEDIDLLKKLK